MPNGTVDHFQLAGSEIVAMLGEWHADTVVGDVTGGGAIDTPRPGGGESIDTPRPLTVASLKQIAQEADAEKVIVFLQDYGDFILPFSGGAFVSIGEKSVLYEKLAQYGHEYKAKMLAEHRGQAHVDPKDDPSS